MKSYTDLEQSKKLAEILPVESADQTWERIAIAGANLDVPEEMEYWHNGNTPCFLNSKIGVPCWSLAALLDILPNQFNECTKTLYWFNNTWYCAYVDEDFEYEVSMSGNNPVDACVEMFFELKRLIDNNLL